MASACRIAASASRASADLTVFREDTGDYHPNCRFPAIYRHAVPVVSTTREFRHCTKVGFRRKSPAAAQEKILNRPNLETLRRSIKCGSGESAATTRATGRRDWRRLRGWMMYATTPAKSAKRTTITTDTASVVISGAPQMPR
jgi:hypothetical protein